MLALHSYCFVRLKVCYYYLLGFETNAYHLLFLPLSGCKFYIIAFTYNAVCVCGIGAYYIHVYMSMYIYWYTLKFQRVAPYICLYIYLCINFKRLICT